MTQLCIFEPVSVGPEPADLTLGRLVSVRCRKCGPLLKHDGQPVLLRLRPDGSLPPIRANCQTLDLAALGGEFSVKGAERAEPRPLCAHLGPQVGESECAGCRGNVRVKQYACHGPPGGVTTIAGCGTCAHYQPVGQVFNPSSSGRLQTCPTLLLRFTCGLGDHIQLTVLLQHVRALYPHVAVDLACHASKATGFVEAGLVRAVYNIGSEPAGSYDAERRLYWHEPATCYADSPSTKAERCLKEIFGIAPREEFCSYKIGVSQEAIGRAHDWLEQTFDRRPFVLWHYQGHTARGAKNITEPAIARGIQAAAQAGHGSLVLDFDRQSTLVQCGVRSAERGVDRPRVHFLRGDAPLGIYGGADAETLGAIACCAALCVGIDSGPGKVMSASGAPTILLWDLMHPLHYAGLNHNVLHVVRRGHERSLYGDEQARRAGLAYFHEHYRYRLLARNYEHDLPVLVEEMLANSECGMRNAE